jgi:hypothetical protein
MLFLKATCRLLTNIGAYCRYLGSPTAGLLGPDEAQSGQVAPPIEESDDDIPEDEAEYEDAPRSSRPPLRDAGFRRAFGQRVRSVRSAGTAARPSKQVEAFLQEQADTIERWARPGRFQRDGQSQRLQTSHFSEPAFSIISRGPLLGMKAKSMVGVRKRSR